MGAHTNLVPLLVWYLIVLIAYLCPLFYFVTFAGCSPIRLKVDEHEIILLLMA